MKTINFDNGVREYALNGDEKNVIRVNVSDVNLMHRLAQLENKVNEMLGGAQSGELTGEALFKLDTELKAAVNEAFGADICTPAFGAVNCLSPVSDGRTIFESFFEAFLPAIKEDIESFAKARAEKAAAYVSAAEEFE